MAESKSSAKDEPKGRAPVAHEPRASAKDEDKAREPAEIVVKLRDDNDNSVHDVTSLAVRLGGTVTGHGKGTLTVECALGADRDEGASAREHLVAGLLADPLVTDVESK